MDSIKTFLELFKDIDQTQGKWLASFQLRNVYINLSKVGLLHRPVTEIMYKDARSEMPDFNNLHYTAIPHNPTFAIHG